MIVFKTFWKIVKKYIGIIISFTVMLLIFGTINLKSDTITTDFIETKPNITIIDKDNSKLSKELISYLEKVTNIKDIKESDIDDAIFYRDISYYINIPKNFEYNILNNIDSIIYIKSSNDYTSTLTNMYLNRYLDVIKYENNNNTNIKLDNTKVNIISNLDKTNLSKLDRYYNFASYTIISVIMFVIGIVLSSFNNTSINKRITVSSMNYKKHNRYIIYSSIIYVFIVDILYILLGYLSIGNIIFSNRGILYILNTFIFSYTSLTLAILASSLTNNKAALNGLINVVGLSQSFLCGAFIPSIYLPDEVIHISKIFPAYYYINNNDYLCNIEKFMFTPYIKNIIILIIFSIIFIIINNYIKKKKRVFA